VNQRPATAARVKGTEPYHYRVTVRTSIKRQPFTMAEFKNQISPQKDERNVDTNINLINDLVSSRDSKNFSVIKSEASQ